MKAGVVHAKNDIRYEKIEKPAVTRGKVLVKVKYTGICGSDIPRVNGDACHYFPNVLETNRTFFCEKPVLKYEHDREDTFTGKKSSKKIIKKGDLELWLRKK